MYNGPGLESIDFLLNVEPDIEETFLLLPVPASRPRVTKFGTHYSKTYKAFQKNAAKVITDCDVKLYGRVFIVTDFMIPKARTSKLQYPSGDIDNYQKAIYDALTDACGYWKDDNQIISALPTKTFTPFGSRPRLKVYIWSLDK